MNENEPPSEREQRSRARNVGRMEVELGTLRQQMETMTELMENLQNEQMKKEIKELSNMLQTQQLMIDNQKCTIAKQKDAMLSIAGGILPHMTVNDEQRAIEEARKVDIYGQDATFGLNDQQEERKINDEESDPNTEMSQSLWQQESNERRCKKLLTEFTPKLTKSTHLARWFTNFEFYARSHKIPIRVIEERFIVDLTNEEIRNKWLAEKEIKKLTNTYVSIREWLYDHSTGKKQILAQRQEIFKWTNKETTITKAYESFLLVVKAYIRELTFAKLNNIPEFQFDRPSEASLVKHFINKVRKPIGADLTRTLTKMKTCINMALLKLACDKIAKSEETLLGMEVNQQKLDTKMEAMITERVSKEVNAQVYAIKSFNNWGKTNAVRDSYGNQGNNKPYGGYRGRGRGRGRYGYRGGRRGRPRSKSRFNSRMGKFNRSKITCFHCRKTGHKKAQCWELHPQLKKSFLERVKDERIRKSLFIMETDPEGYLTIKPQGSEYDKFEENICQEQIFIMTNDDFEFEYVNPCDNKQTPTTSEPRTTPKQKETHEHNTLHDFLDEAVQLECPRTGAK